MSHERFPFLRLLSAMWGSSKKLAVYKPEEGSNQNPARLVPWFQTCNFLNYEKYISAVYKPPRLWYFVVAAWADQDSCQLKISPQFMKDAGLQPKQRKDREVHAIGVKTFQ